jgi:hypothetical protein
MFGRSNRHGNEREDGQGISMELGERKKREEQERYGVQ